MRVTEADNRMVAIVAVIRMWDKGVWPQAYEAQRQVGAAQTMTSPLNANKWVYIRNQILHLLPRF